MHVLCLGWFKLVFDSREDIKIIKCLQADKHETNKKWSGKAQLSFLFLHYHNGVEGDSDNWEYSNCRRAAYNSCNFNFREPKFIPVIFHNLREFDPLLTFGKAKR